MMLHQGLRLGGFFGLGAPAVATNPHRCEQCGSFGSLAPPSLSPLCRFDRSQRHLLFAICYLSCRPSLRRGWLISLLVQDVMIEGALKMGRDFRFWSHFGAKHFFDLGGDAVSIA
jgi:hypothetical protein